jgi:hypothetical protein
MDRPKSDRYFPLKMPSELLDDIAVQCARYPQPKSAADWIKEACELRLITVQGLTLGYYTLRVIVKEAGHGHTK